MPNAVYPGSFDPFTLGHLDVLRRAVRLFPSVTLAVGVNPEKERRAVFPVEERVAALEDLVDQEGLAVPVIAFRGLLVDLCRERDLKVVVRGVRSAADLDHESTMAWTNRTQVPDLETVLLPSAPARSFLSSRLVRQIAKAGGDLSDLVPEPVASRYLASLARRSSS